MYSAHIYSDFIRLSWSLGDLMESDALRWMMIENPTIMVKLADRPVPGDGFAALPAPGLGVHPLILG